MEIEIRLTTLEATKIIIEHFQPMFPDKIITGNIDGYSNTVELTVTDKSDEKEGEKNNGE